ncbi:UDP-glycosyltransferase 86A2-like [Canna indica]|uniref:Glycosyltransferase n=1 Tax=Canna indica TaxID=4628 RepID=A0AAQ3KIP5_9LILI|nr:UDP-glycosyltransferase 86A2-like [Canna indica]
MGRVRRHFDRRAKPLMVKYSIHRVVSPYRIRIPIINLPSTLIPKSFTAQHRMADSGSTAKPHALLVPEPAHGHFTPAAKLAINLAAKGFTVTFVNTEAFHRQLTASGHPDDVFAAAHSEGLDIRYETVSDGLPLSFDRSLLPDQFLDALCHLLPCHVEELMRKLLLGDPPIQVLIADTFFLWPSTLAEKFGVPYVSFWTQPALVFSLYHHMPLLVGNGHWGYPNEGRRDTITYIPGVPAIEPTDLVSFFQAPEASSVLLQMVTKAFEDVKRADFVLCNAVEELEPDTISALQEERRPFYAVGPLMSPVGFDGCAVTASIWAESDCSSWLDSMPPRSVLYVSFGSLVSVRKRDMEEIAYGVLQSKANFLWALRPGSVSTAEAGDGPLPDAIAEASRSRGLVVPWCRQREVLGHPAVGGFLTHCGWNSVLESMWCGVPMLCSPVLSDQPTNRKLVVEDLRIGMDVGGVGEVQRDEVSSKIDGLMGGELGAKMRMEIEKVRKAMESAWTPRGSSSNSFNKFTVDLLKHLSLSK